jgi:hypothetical protein
MREFVAARSKPRQEVVVTSQIISCSDIPVELMEQYVTDAAHPAKQPQEAANAMRIVLLDFLERRRDAVDPLISAMSRKQVAKLPEDLHQFFNLFCHTFSAANVWDELHAERLSRN